MMGVFQEHGPYVSNDGTDYLIENMWSWNNQANMLYIEMPGGVGFSTCDADGGECVFDDQKTADDNIIAIVNWFAKYKDFENHDLYVSGESYGGVYVPFAAKGMLEYNTKVTDPTLFKFNLKGFIVGNGVTNWTYDTTPAYIKMGFWHGLYDYDTYLGMEAENCDFSKLQYGNVLSAKCAEYFNRFNELTANINTYDVFRKCWSTTTGMQMYSEDNFGLAKVGNELKPYKKYYTAADYTPWLIHRNVATAKKMVELLPPCVYGSFVVDYLNRYATRDALHIPDEVQAWSYCTDANGWDYTAGEAASFDIYAWMKTNHPEINIMLYSGDTDGSVPTWGTLDWINALGWEQTQEWTPYYWEKQVAGYTQVHEQLTFGSIHGCGHMAPQWKRPETWNLIYNWMDTMQKKQ